ncbi:MAG: hypothetical protein H8D26_09680 [Methanomicrobia archaeon]|nr:hypothetical protein [Methanomicrobia archaeon]
MGADKIERKLEEKKVYIKRVFHIREVKNAVKSRLRKRIFSEVEYV